MIRSGLVMMPLLALAALGTPAAAQESAGEKVVQQFVYGEDECEASDNPEEIVVCVRMDESERFRIPENLRANPNSIANTAWTERVRSLERVGATGINSCSPSGVGGFTGCTTQLIEDAYAERANNGDVQAGRLIAEKRQERLSRIDEDAAAVEAREREVEAELESRKAEREAALAKMRAQAEGRDLPEEPAPETDTSAPES